MALMNEIWGEIMETFLEISFYTIYCHFNFVQQCSTIAAAVVHSNIYVVLHLLKMLKMNINV